MTLALDIEPMLGEARIDTFFDLRGSPASGPAPNGGPDTPTSRSIPPRRPPKSRSFQQSQQLAPSGEFDHATRAALLDVHGS
ncbi:MAG: hypothetical protein AAGA56_18305 [Myxococcota bacterium]